MVFKSNKESRKESLRARWDCRCESQKNVFCKVLEQVIDCFGAAITKRNSIFCPKMAKKCHFVALNSVFGALSGQL